MQPDLALSDRPRLVFLFAWPPAFHLLLGRPHGEAQVCGHFYLCCWAFYSVAAPADVRPCPAAVLPGALNPGRSRAASLFVY